MRINNTSNHQFHLSAADRKGKPEETGKQRGHSDKPVELHIQDILDISGKVPKMPGTMQNGKFYLDVPEELQNRTLESTEPGGVVKTDGGLAPWQVDINETTYEKYGDSNLLNVKNEALRNGYYHSLFVADTDKVNSVFGLSYQLNGWIAHNAEKSTARYEELREQVIGAFGDNKELLDKHLASLDKAFEFNLQRVATSDSRRVWIDQVMDRAAKIKGEEPPYELNKLALHKDFDFDKFEANAKNLMKQFAKEFLTQIQTGVDYATAREYAVEMMTLSTKTTSVNELSFSDFMVFDGLPWSNATTKAENLAALSRRNLLFNNSAELSEELRELLK